jgi:hypothetical protein
MWVLEEQITIGDRSHDHETKPARPVRLRLPRQGRLTPPENLLGQRTSQNLTQQPRKIPLKES